MRKNTLLLTGLIAISFLSSCELIGDIFQAGFYTAIFLVVAIVAVIIWVTRFFRRR
jgi:hypothetical protein